MIEARRGRCHPTAGGMGWDFRRSAPDARKAGRGRGIPFAERKARVDAEVARLIGLGATSERGAIERDEEYWARLNDPEGNEFCVQ